MSACDTWAGLWSISYILPHKLQNKGTSLLLVSFIKIINISNCLIKAKWQALHNIIKTEETGSSQIDNAGKQDSENAHMMKTRLTTLNCDCNKKNLFIISNSK